MLGSLDGQVIGIMDNRKIDPASARGGKCLELVKSKRPTVRNKELTTIFSCD
jgi:hypothetical protein